jgi:hypothetical protein
VLSGGLALYWLAQDSGLDAGALPHDGTPTVLPTEVRPRVRVRRGRARCPGAPERQPVLLPCRQGPGRAFSRCQGAHSTGCAVPTNPLPQGRWRCSLPEKRGSVGYGMALRRNSSGVCVEHGASNQTAAQYARLVDGARPLSGTCPGLTVYKVRACVRACVCVP